MRVFMILLPALALAQTPPATTPAAPKPATPGATGAGRGTAGRGAAGRGAVAPKPAAPPPLTTDEQKTVYALGLMMGQSIAPFNLSPAEIEIVKRALTDSAAGKPALDRGPGDMRERA